MSTDLQPEHGAEDGASRPGRNATRVVATASILVTVGMIAGRVLGLLQQILIADSFGATREADLAVLLLALPDLLVALVGTGAIGLVFMPILLAHEDDEQISLLRRLTGLVLALATPVAAGSALLVIVVASGWATQSGISDGQFRWAVVLAAATIPPAIAVALTTAFLQARDRFAVTAFATAVFNTPVIVALLIRPSLVSLGVGLAVGGFCRYGMQVLSVGGEWKRRQVEPVRLSSSIRWTTIAAAAASSISIVLQMSLPLLIAGFAGDEGDVALVNYGWKILLVPIGILGTLLTVAAYPSIIRLLGENPRPSGNQLRKLHSLIRPGIYLAALTAVWLWVDGVGIAELVFDRGSIPVRDLEEIGAELRYGAAAVPLLTVGTAAAAMLYGLKKPARALACYAVAIPVLLGAGIALFKSLGPRGLMIAVALYALAFCVTAVVALRWECGILPLSPVELIGAPLAIAAATAMAVAVRATTRPLGSVAVLANGTVLLATMGAVYAFATLALSQRRTAQSRTGPGPRSGDNI